MFAFYASRPSAIHLQIARYRRLLRPILVSSARVRILSTKNTTSARTQTVSKKKKKQDDNSKSNEKQAGKGDGKRQEDTPIAKFFADCKHPYNPRAPVMPQFLGMCESRGWERQPRLPKSNGGHGQKAGPWERARRRLDEALVQQFNNAYGTDVKWLANWQKLCRELGVSPVPSTIKKCCEAVDGIHVNIVDLLDCRQTGCWPVLLHTSEKALAEYCIAQDKVLSRKTVSLRGADLTLLKYLLRRIIETDRREVIKSWPRERKRILSSQI